MPISSPPQFPQSVKALVTGATRVYWQPPGGAPPEEEVRRRVLLRTTSDTVWLKDLPIEYVLQAILLDTASLSWRRRQPHGEGAFAEFVRYKHNDMDDLERVLSKLPPEAAKLVVSDGVFSTSGELVRSSPARQMCPRL